MVSLLPKRRSLSLWKKASILWTVAGFYLNKVDGDVDSVGGEPPEASCGGAAPQVPEPLRLQLPHQGPQQQQLLTTNSPALKWKTDLYVLKF